MAGAGEASKILTFRAGGKRLALPAHAVTEILRRPPVTRVPHAPGSLTGVANVRGEVIPVVSLPRLLGDETAASEASRVIVLDRSPVVGLEVDEVSALREAEGGEAGGLLLLEDEATRLVDLDSLLKAEFGSLAQGSRRLAPRAAQDDVGEAAAEEEIAVLAFEVAGQAYALPLDHVREVIALPPEVVSLPRTDEAMIGVVNLRERLVPLTSLRALLGLSRAALSPTDRVLIARIGQSVVGLVVDRLQAIVRAPVSAVGPVPAILNRGAGEAQIDAILRVGGGRGMISLLAPERLFRDESVAQILADGRQKGPDMAAQEQALATERFVIFTLGEEQYGLPIEVVEEVVSLPETLTRVPRAPAFVSGVMNLRGTVVPVIDQRQRFGVSGAGASTRRRVIITRIGELRAGFVVDAVAEIRSVATDQLRSTPELTADARRLFDRIANVEVDGRMILLIDPQELLDRAEAELLAAMANA